MGNLDKDPLVDDYSEEEKIVREDLKAKERAEIANNLESWAGSDPVLALKHLVRNAKEKLAKLM